MMMWPDSWGPLVSEMRERAGYQFGLQVSWTMGRIWRWAEPLPLGPFLFFSLFSSFLFLFPISFITFANLVQIESNQFVNFSKIQINTVRQ
jgi:hypothetical protein